jgi:hypothetical protein
MLPPGFKAIVSRLDAGSLTQLMRGLLQAEAARLGLPTDAVVASDVLTAADGGLDARIDDVPETSQTIPPGLVGLQFKAVKSTAPSSLDLSTELAKPGPTRVLRSGGTYVLVWQADLNDKQHDATQTALTEAARAVEQNPKIRLWDATAVVGLAENHAAVVEGFHLAEFGAVYALPELELSLKIEERPYEPDPAREDAIAQIRSRATSGTDDPSILTLRGLPGTGKTRLVVEALNVDGLRDRVLYTRSPEGINSFINRVVRDDRTSGILVVDEFDEAALAALSARLAATKGRWRFVSIMSHTSLRLTLSGSRDIALRPLRDLA